MVSSACPTAEENDLSVFTPLNAVAKCGLVAGSGSVGSKLSV
jgi:hypothetical protein